MRTVPNRLHVDASDRDSIRPFPYIMQFSCGGVTLLAFFFVRPMSLHRMARSFSVVDDLKGGEPYDTVEYSRAFFSLFEGAIYLHQVERGADAMWLRMSRLSAIRNDLMEVLLQANSMSFHRTFDNFAEASSCRTYSSGRLGPKRANQSCRGLVPHAPYPEGFTPTSFPGS